MIPHGGPKLVLSSSSNASTTEHTVNCKNTSTTLLGLNVVETNDSIGVLQSPTRNRRSCLKGSWGVDYSSTSTLGSSFSSASASQGFSSSRSVTFDDHVKGKIFLPDWADERVATYETSMCHQPATPDATQLRFVDWGHIQALRREHEDLGNGTAAIGRAKSGSVSLLTQLEDEWSSRGLELLIDDELCNRKSHWRLQSTLRVLFLQYRKASWDEVAHAYSVVSRTSQLEAHQRGVLDEMEVAS